MIVLSERANILPMDEDSRRGKILRRNRRRGGGGDLGDK